MKQKKGVSSNCYYDETAETCHATILDKNITVVLTDISVHVMLVFLSKNYNIWLLFQCLYFIFPATYVN